MWSRGEEDRKSRGIEVECYKCGKKEHKCRKYLLGEKKERVAHIAKLLKAHQQRELACPKKEKAQEGERRLRRVEEEEVACVAKL